MIHYKYTEIFKEIVTVLMCSIFLALIRRIKCTKGQQIHFKFIDVLLLCNGHPHVSARTRLHLLLKRV